MQINQVQIVLQILFASVFVLCEIGIFIIQMFPKCISVKLDIHASLRSLRRV